MTNQSSNKTMYWALGGVIILAVIAFGGYKVWHHYNKGLITQNATISTSQTTPSLNTQAGTGNSGLPQKTNTSNQQLDQDLQNIQNSMNQLQQDQGAANNDTNNTSQDTPQQ